MNIVIVQLNGDGVTDNTAKLQEAIDSVKPGGTLVIAPENDTQRTFLLRDPAPITDNKAIHGV